jgi:DNA polymerase III alpha subunit (gram-positive type)
MDYVIYVADVETTGLDYVNNDIIELSLYRMKDNVQKTWLIKPTNINNIDAGSLRINGHKLEDITHATKFGRDNYKEASSAIIEIENWIMEDDVPTENRVLCGQNVGFDRNFLERLWLKCNAKDTYPFGRRLVDTMSIEFFMDLCKGKMAEGYSLSNLTKKYGVKNEKAHSAEADTKATKEVFEKQVEFFTKALKNL